jgi:hypothetical protein
VRIKERFELLASADGSEEARLAIIAKMARDPVFFVNVALWTFDPRIKDPHRRYIPFLLFPKQEEYVRWLKARIDADQDGLTEKSRDTGATWCVLAVLLHGWLFERGFTALVGSKIVDLVDKQGDPTTLFWKFLFMVDNLPWWLKPPGWKNDKPWRTYLKIENPLTKAVITGASSGVDFGRSGRFKVVFPDEFAAWEYASSAWTSSGETTNCRLPVSTPRGMNFFGQLANPRNRSAAMDKFRIHWKDDPRHARTEIDERTQRPFYPYERKARKRYDYDPTMMAQELEIDYKRSAKGRCYPTIDRVDRGVFRRDPKSLLYVSWDFGRTDATAIGWCQWVRRLARYQMIDYVEFAGQGIEFYVPFVTGNIPTGVDWEYSEDQIAVIQRHRGWQVEAHFGDPAGKQRNPVTNTSVIETLELSGIYVQVNEKSKSFEARITNGRKLLRKLDVDEERCALWLDAMENAKFLQSREGARQPRKMEPEHDWTCMAPETKIRTLRGWTAIKDLEGDEPFWVWGYSETERRLVPAQATRCWKSGADAELVEVRLDDGHSIKSTPEHQFMRRSGEWVEARSLQPGDSLMPFYEFGSRGYNRIRLNDGSVADEHVFVYTRLNGMPNQGCHVHHIDGDKYNNDPSNLELQTIADHCRITLRRHNQDKAKMSSASQKGYRSASKVTKPCQMCGNEYLGSFKSLYCSKECRAAVARINQTVARGTVLIVKNCKICGAEFVGPVRRKTCSDVCQVENKRLITQQYNERQSALLNHKVLSVSPAGRSDVYDISVPALGNFVAEGVVVHNSHGRSMFEYLAVNDPHSYDLVVDDESISEEERAIRAEAEDEGDGDPMFGDRGLAGY